VNQERFLAMVEELLREGTAWAAKEPNDPRTWARIHAAVGAYLAQEWRDGALVGTTAREAFYIHCGLGTTMTQRDIDEGRLRFEVGLALKHPAQFVVLKISHSTRAV
jgi:phage tail sheath protein FI